MNRNGTGLNNNQIRCIAENDDGTLWIGTSEGLNIYYPDKELFTYCQRHNNIAGSLSYNIINCIYKDKHSSVWLGTHGGGIDLHTALSEQFQRIDPQIEAGHNYGFIGPLVEHKNKLWIGTEGGGLASYDFRTHAYRHFDLTETDGQDLNSNTIRALCADTNNILWIGTYAAGVQAFNTKNQQIDNSLYPTLGNIIVNGIFRDSRGNIWIGSNTEKGVYVKPKDKQTFTCGIAADNLAPPLHLPWIRTICEAHTGEIWFGSIYYGLYIWKKGQSIRHLSTDNSALSSDYISILFCDSDNRMWIGTSGGGINIYDSCTGEIKTLTTANGLLNDNVCSIIEDSQSYIWISTVAGVSRYNPNDDSFINYSYTKSNFPIETLNLKSGLLTSEGKIYFGGNNGLACFHPENIAPNTLQPPVVFTKLIVNNEEIQTGDSSEILVRSLSETHEITLRHNQTNITIEFAALNYIFPQNNRYMFYLQGYDPTWNKPGYRRTATYTNLPSGKYILKVKASNNSDLWSRDGIQLVIRVLPPPWQTGWAYLIYFASVLSIICIVVRYFLSKMKLKNDLQLQAMERQAIEQTYRSHINLFTNFAHELRTPLTLILGPLKKITTDITLPANVHHSLNMVYRNATKMLTLVNQLMDLRKQESGERRIKVEEGDFVPFIKEIVILFRELAHSKDIELSFHPAGEVFKAFFDPFLMEKVFYNLLSNAIKNTPQGGCISLCIKYIQRSDLPSLSLQLRSRLSEADLYILFSIQDSGKGIPVDNLENVFLPFFQVTESTSPDANGTGIGLPITRGIVEQHHGVIWADNHDKGGACFFIVLPLKKALFKPDEFIQHQLGAESDRSLTSPTPYGRDSQEPDNIHLLPSPKGIPVMLIIDDNADMRTYIHSCLQGQYKIYEACNGKKGIEKAEELIPDIIVSDIMMPVIDGLQLCSCLKNNLKTCHIPIVLLTAKTSIPQIQEGFGSGADDYITKPFDIDLLTARIKSIIENRRRIKKAFLKQFSTDTSDYNQLDNAFLERAKDFIRKNIDKSDLSIEEFGKHLHLSRTQVYRKIKALTGMSPSLFITTFRLRIAADMLRETSLSISEIADKTGFCTPSYFTSCFKKLFHISPTEYSGRDKK